MNRATLLILLVLLWSGVVEADFQLQFQVAGTGRDSLAPGIVTVTLKPGSVTAQRPRSAGIETQTYDLQRNELLANGDRLPKSEADQLIASQLSITEDRISATLTPAGTSRSILGIRCQGYDLSVNIYSESISARVPDASVKGQVWIAGSGPGKDAWRDLVSQLSGAGMTISGLDAALRESERARALMIALETMVSGGIPLEGTVQIEQAGKALGSRLAATLSETVTFSAVRAEEVTPTG